MPPTAQTNTQLDPQAYALTKAIARTETGTSTDPYNAKGKSGEFGAYQFMPDTYKALAKQYLGDENAPPTVENQNKIAYAHVKALKDQGYTPAQVASAWNSGNPDAYKTGLKGTNAKGVAYDVPSYVAKVSQNFRDISSQGTSQVADTPTDTTAPQGSALGTAAHIADAAFGGGKVGDLIGATSVQNNLNKNPTSFMSPDQIANLQKVYANLSPEAKARLEAQGLPTTFEGNAQSAAQTASKNVPLPTGKELLGSVGQTALMGLPEGKIAETLGVGAKALGAGEKLATVLGKVGASTAGGYGFDVASNLEENKTGLGVLKPGLNTLTAGLLTAPGFVHLGIPAVESVGRAAKPATAIAGSLAEGAGNVLTAPFRFIGDKLKNAAEVAALPKAERGLAKSGFSDPARTFLSTATPGTKDAFGQMVDIAEKNANADPLNPQTTGIRARTQAKDVVGKEFLKPVDAIASDARKAGATIQQEAMKPGKVDIGSLVQDFKNNLESKGVLARKNGTLVSTGRVPRSDLKYYEDVLNEIKDVTGGKSSIPRSQAHALRQRLYDSLDLATKTGGTPGAKPFSSLVDNDVNSLRSSIADEMGAKYKDAAKRYAVNQKALSNVAKFAGVPAKIENISSKSLKLGEGLMRALGNASDKPTSLINEITELAKQRGYKSDVNINDLIDFADNLEDLYGIKQTRSFEGGIRRGTEQAMPHIPKTPTELVMKAAQAATKQSNQDKIDALKKFLGK